MADESSFVDLVRKVRAGDAAASAELVRRYEPAIRVAVRGRLSSDLRRMLDSLDISQSVFANFFARATLGEFELDKPERLIQLLATMARNRVIDHALRQQAARRDCRRTEYAPDQGGQIVDRGPSPSDAVSEKDLVEAFQRRLSAEERHLADERAQGRPWSDIAVELGSRPDALRVKLDRAFHRVSRELRLET